MCDSLTRLNPTTIASVGGFKYALGGGGRKDDLVGLLTKSGEKAIGL